MKREYRKRSEERPSFLGQELLDRIAADTNLRLLELVKANRKKDEEK